MLSTASTQPDPSFVTPVASPPMHGIQRLHSFSLTLTRTLWGWVASPPTAQAQQASFCQLTSQQIAQQDQLRPAQQRGIPAGAVFFPEGNQFVGQNGLFPGKNPNWIGNENFANCAELSEATSTTQKMKSLISPRQIPMVEAGVVKRRMLNR